MATTRMCCTTWIWPGTGGSRDPGESPEASVTDAIVADLQPEGITLSALHIDRGFLSSPLMRIRPLDAVLEDLKGPKIPNVAQGYAQA